MSSECTAITALVSQTSGTFHSTKTTTLNFGNFQLRMEQPSPKFPKKRTTSRGIPKFSKNFSREFSFHSTLLPGFLEFSVEWLAFLETFPGHFCTICRCFQIFESLVVWKAPVISRRLRVVAIFPQG